MNIDFDAIRALQAKAKAEGFTRHVTENEEKAFMDDLSGEPEMAPGPPGRAPALPGRGRKLT